MKVIQVPLRMIQPNPEQPRKTFAPEELEELAASIREYGVLQPLLVKRGADRSLILIAGERRFRAAGLAGLAKVPVIMKELESRGLVPSCFMVVNDGSYAAGCVVSCSAEAGAAVEVGSVITVYIAADPSVEITTEPPAASDSGSGESASSSEETAPDDTVHDTE